MKRQYSVKDIDLLFETSWEVCNKIGGIYTVLSTKARELQQLFPDKVVFIGPDVWSEQNPSPYFIERKTLLKSAASKCQLPHGLKMRVGRWNIPGSPVVILIDFKPLFPLLNGFYGEMWERYGVDSLHAYGDYGEGCAFALAAAMVIEAVTKHLKINPRGVIAHFDEWTTGMGLLYTRAHLPEAATIFTTHATSIGRSICGNGKELYKYFDCYNGDRMAAELNMEAKHSLEKSAAKYADCFTTVSEVTARECAQLLDVPVDVVTPNGFEPDFVPDSTKYGHLRKAGRRHLLQIAKIMSGKDWDDDTCIVVTSGRNEYRNKGLDLFLDSISRLSESLHGTGRKVLAIVAVPAWVREPNKELLFDLKDNGTLPVEPDYMTHRLNNEDSDLVTCRMRALRNEQRNDNVKIIYIPCYLDGSDGIVNISYYDLLPAVDITVFPSYYEPWGYTPLESIAFGVPAVTTDKSGFGQWILSAGENGIFRSGVTVIPRDDDNYSDSALSISETLLSYINATPQQVAEARQGAERTAGKADWHFFIKDYLKAFGIAQTNRNKRNKSEITK